MSKVEAGAFRCTRGGAYYLFVFETLPLTPADLARWRSEGRADILQEWEGLSQLVLQDKRAGQLQARGYPLFYPFLRYEGRQARCHVEDTKPEACRHYRCGARASPTRLRVELNPENSYDKTRETIRQQWGAYVQAHTQEGSVVQVALILGDQRPPPAEGEALPRLERQWEGEGAREKCVSTTAELKRYLVWGWR
jgi:hypothetical protein